MCYYSREMSSFSDYGMYRLQGRWDLKTCPYWRGVLISEAQWSWDLNTCPYQMVFLFLAHISHITCRVLYPAPAATIFGPSCSYPFSEVSATLNTSPGCDRDAITLTVSPYLYILAKDISLCRERDTPCPTQPHCVTPCVPICGIIIRFVYHTSNRLPAPTVNMVGLF